MKLSQKVLLTDSKINFLKISNGFNKQFFLYLIRMQNIFNEKKISSVDI